MTETRAGCGPDIYPTLRYKDAHAAIDWLEQAFGFERLMVVDGEGGTVAHAELRFGNGVIMLGSPASDGITPPSAPENINQTHGIYIAVDDVDALHDRAKAAGAEIVSGLTDQDYGSREFSARDPEGYLWGFGTHRVDL